MSAPQAPPPSGGGPASPGGRWEWAAYPGQEPQWYWFADPPVVTSAGPGRPAGPGVGGGLRRRARRAGVLLLVLGLVCAGAVAYGQLTEDRAGEHVALDVDGDPPEPAAAEPAGAEDAPAGEPPEQQAVLDELADTLRARAQAATDAMLGGDTEAALEYVEPSCRDAVREPMASAVGAARAAFEGVRMVVSSVVVTATEGKVAYRTEGSPSEAAAEFAVATEEMPELWAHRDGHWYRDIAECRTDAGPT